MIAVFIILYNLLSLAHAECNPVCRNPCNSSSACFGTPCPTVLGPGQLAVQFFNYSNALVSFTMGVSPGQLVICTVLDLYNYRRLLNNQSITYDYRSPPFEWTCQLEKGGNSMGRGWALVYACQSARCDLWHEELANLVSDPCAVNCTTGDVGDGVCDPACNVSACSFDDGDCRAVLETTSSNPDQGLNSSIPTPSTSRQCYPGCDASMIGDGVCQPACSLSICNRDGGDCSQTTPCDGNPCLNGGICSFTPGSPGFHCECINSYCGTQCQYPIWSQASLTGPTEPFCLTEFSVCKQTYETFKLCCYGSVTNCTGAPGTLHSGPAPSSPNPAHKLSMF